MNENELDQMFLDKRRKGATLLTFWLNETSLGALDVIEPSVFLMGGVREHFVYDVKNPAQQAPCRFTVRRHGNEFDLDVSAHWDFNEQAQSTHPGIERMTFTDAGIEVAWADPERPFEPMPCVNIWSDDLARLNAAMAHATGFMEKR